MIDIFSFWVNLIPEFPKNIQIKSKKNGLKNGSKNVSSFCLTLKIMGSKLKNKLLLNLFVYILLSNSSRTAPYRHQAAY